MPVLSARNLEKAFGAKPLFLGLSLTIRRGEHVGLLGANGTGKSTLLRVLAGLEESDEGIIERRREASVLYLAQEPEFYPAKTPHEIVEEGLQDWYQATSRYNEITDIISRGEGHDALMHEQAALGETIERLGGWTKNHLIDEILEKLGVLEPHRPVGTMSGGERRRVALAKILVVQPSLALLDEPTNHLDATTIEWLEAYLRDEFKGAVLLVTHDRYVLDAVADRVVELDDGKLTEFIGGYSDYLEQKAELLAHADRVEDKRLNTLRREREWLARGPKARTTKQKARIERAEELMAVKGPSRRDAMELEGIETGVQRMGKTILEFKDVSYDIAGRKLIERLTFGMRTGERIGIIGPNGAGKTTLLKLVTGELRPTHGKVIRGVWTKLAMFDQARANLIDDWSIIDNVAEHKGADQTGGGHVQMGERTMEMRQYLEQFLFDKSKQRQPVGSLSGGERARVALAKALKEGANMLLLDEPTNDLDVATLGALEELLCVWPGCVLVVSHDRYFLNRVVTSLLVFEGEGAVVHYPGNYDTYRSLREEQEAQKKELARDSKNESQKRDSKRAQPKTTINQTLVSEMAEEAKPLTYAERIELDGLLEKIEEAESQVSIFENRLSDPALYTQPPDVAKEVQENLKKAQASVVALTERWEFLEARRDVKKKN